MPLGKTRMSHINKAAYVKGLTADDGSLKDGQSLPAELRTVFPNWVANGFLRAVPYR